MYSFFSNCNNGLFCLFSLLAFLPVEYSELNSKTNITLIILKLSIISLLPGAQAIKYPEGAKKVIAVTASKVVVIHNN